MFAVQQTLAKRISALIDWGLYASELSNVLLRSFIKGITLTYFDGADKASPELIHCVVNAMPLHAKWLMTLSELI